MARSPADDQRLHRKRTRLDSSEHSSPYCITPLPSLSYETGRSESEKTSNLFERCVEIGSGAKYRKLDMMWHCPSKFVLEMHWLVADGLESFEVGYQIKRESEVSEVIYPCSESIPDSPLEPQNDFKAVNDSLIFQVPLTSDEDEEDAGSSDVIKKNAQTNLSDPLKPLSNRKPDADSRTLTEDNPLTTPLETASQIADVQIAAAAAAACMMVKSLERHIPVDHDLLIALLKNPALIEALVSSNKGPDPTLLRGQLGSDTTQSTLLSKYGVDSHNPSPNTTIQDSGWSVASSFGEKIQKWS